MPAALNLARDLADMKRRLAALERAGRAGSAAIDDVEGGSLDVTSALVTGMSSGIAAASAQASVADVKSNGSIRVQTASQSYDLQRALAALTQFTGLSTRRWGQVDQTISSTTYASLLYGPNGNDGALGAGLGLGPNEDGATFGADSLIEGTNVLIEVQVELDLSTGSTAPAGLLYVNCADAQGTAIKTYAVKMGANERQRFVATWIYPYVWSSGMTIGADLSARLQSSGGSYTVRGAQSLLITRQTVGSWSTVRA